MKTTDATPADANERTVGITRISTGLSWLDKLLGGGPPAGSVVLISGTPGTGKSILIGLVAKANAEKCLSLENPSSNDIARHVGSKDRAEVVTICNSDRQANQTLFSMGITAYQQADVARTLAEDKRAIVLVEARIVPARAVHVSDAVIDLRVVKGTTEARVRKNRHGDALDWTPVPELDAAKRKLA